MEVVSLCVVQATDLVAFRSIVDESMDMGVSNVPGDNVQREQM